MSASVADHGARRGSLRIILSVVGALLATLLILTGVISLLRGSPGQPRSSLVGTKVSAFTILPGVSGGAIRAPWLRHHPAVLLFFAD